MFGGRPCSSGRREEAAHGVPRATPARTRVRAGPRVSGGVGAIGIQATPPGRGGERTFGLGVDDHEQVAARRAPRRLRVAGCGDATTTGAAKRHVPRGRGELRDRPVPGHPREPPAHARLEPLLPSRAAASCRGPHHPGSPGTAPTTATAAAGPGFPPQGERQRRRHRLHLPRPPQHRRRGDHRGGSAGPPDALRVRRGERGDTSAAGGTTNQSRARASAVMGRRPRGLRLRGGRRAPGPGARTRGRTRTWTRRPETVIVARPRPDWPPGVRPPAAARGLPVPCSRASAAASAASPACSPAACDAISVKIARATDEHERQEADHLERCLSARAAHRACGRKWEVADTRPNWSAPEPPPGCGRTRAPRHQRQSAPAGHARAEGAGEQRAAPAASAPSACARAAARAATRASHSAWPASSVCPATASSAEHHREEHDEFHRRLTPTPTRRGEWMEVRSMPAAWRATACTDLHRFVTKVCRPP